MYNVHTTRWEARFDGWRAIVESLSTRGAWHAAIKRRYPPYTYRDQTDFGWPRAAMAWCEEEIMRQRWRGWSANPRPHDGPSAALLLPPADDD